jgi:hypothetical protein
MNDPKILLLDIETSPTLCWTWGVYEQNALEIAEHSKLLSYSVKWLGTPQRAQVTRGLCDVNYNEYLLVQEIWDFLDRADIVVAHNGKNFDVRKLNARFIKWSMKPPSPYAIVDTRTEVKRVSAFESNKLDWLCAQLDLGRKLEHEGIGLWLRCLAKDLKAWRTMLRYNAHDVVLLERLYKLLAPWIRQPNANTWSNRPICSNPACGKPGLTRRGVRRSKTRLYIRYQCKHCGSWSQDVRSFGGASIKPV